MHDDESLVRVDPEMAELIHLERTRQQDKLILIASESYCPEPVRRVLASEFGHVYAEGYPARWMDAASAPELLDVADQQAHHRRLSDRRYYRGCETANLIESLAQRRCADLFVSSEVQQRLGLRPDDLHVNVQPLSGAAANNAVYAAFLQPGDLVMGMDLTHGGHLTHGSPSNRSGRQYAILRYGVDPKTQRLDYDRVIDLAREHRPKMIIAGYSAYPWQIDWSAFRRAADAAGGAVLLADIAHPAGLVAAGVYPNPLGYADVISFTTHKTLCGPRGAVLMTTDAGRARRLDRAVFPGEQGGPHMHAIAAKAVCFRLAATADFQALCRRTVENAAALARAFADLGVRLAYGGTDTHLLLVDLRGYGTALAYRPAGGDIPLTAEVAARFLDFIDITVNKNTLPGDTSPAYPSGLRFGTTWVSQRGFGPDDMRAVAQIVHEVLRQVRPFQYAGLTTPLGRGKIPAGVLEEARRRVAALVEANAAKYPPTAPPMGLLSAPCPRATPPDEPALAPCLPVGRQAPVPEALRRAADQQGRCLVQVRGTRARSFLDQALTADMLALPPGGSAEALALDADGRLLAEVTVHADTDGRSFLLAVAPDRVTALIHWLMGLSDGYVLFGHADLYAKIDGPAVVQLVHGLPAVRQGRPAAPAPPSARQTPSADDPRIAWSKSYFVGQERLLARRPAGPAKPAFQFTPAQTEPRPTPLYHEHLKRTSRSRLTPFAGWLMPLWYEGIAAEHQAVRQRAGLFDVSHMAVLEVRGPGAGPFLEVLTTNSVGRLEIGQSHYTYLLEAAGAVLDDLIVYRVDRQRYMIVANAANADKVLAYLHAAADGQVRLDADRPAWAMAVRPEIVDLKSPAAGDEARVDLALQGPASRRLLEEVTGRSLGRLRPFGLVQARLAGIDAILSRTGYTGERWSFELFVHPSRAADVWNLLLERGKETGVVPAGLGARDSLRTEAGFPLYGHELAGPLAISPIEAGYGLHVKLHKPFFVGRQAMVAQLASDRTVVRFRVEATGTRGLKLGDPVTSAAGEVIGQVTSATFVQRQQIGLALVPRRYAAPGTRIGVIALGRGKQAAASFTLEIGSRVPLPEAAVVLRRFGLPADT